MTRTTDAREAHVAMTDVHSLILNTAILHMAGRMTDDALQHLYAIAANIRSQVSGDSVSVPFDVLNNAFLAIEAVKNYGIVSGLTQASDELWAIIEPLLSSSLPSAEEKR